MKFNNRLLTILVLLMSALLFSCANSAKKTAGFDEPGTQQQAIGQSALPAGPVTPNPYLQMQVAVSEAVAHNFQAAVIAIKNKQWDQAETLLQSLSVANPTLSGIALNLGIVYRHKGETDKAAEQFTQAISINAKNLDAYNQLAILKREAGDFSAAENLYKQALQVWPYHSDSHKNIAILYELYKGEPERALPHYLAYQQLLPEPDRQVESWVADLQRRINKVKPAPAANEQAEPSQEQQ